MNPPSTAGASNPTPNTESKSAPAVMGTPQPVVLPAPLASTPQPAAPVVTPPATVTVTSQGAPVIAPQATIPPPVSPVAATAAPSAVPFVLTSLSASNNVVSGITDTFAASSSTVNAIPNTVISSSSSGNNSPSAAIDLGSQYTTAGNNIAGIFGGVQNYNTDLSGATTFNTTWTPVITPSLDTTGTGDSSVTTIFNTGLPQITTTFGRIYSYRRFRKYNKRWILQYTNDAQ